MMKYVVYLMVLLMCASFVNAKPTKAKAKPAKAAKEKVAKLKPGEFRDARDKQIYRLVKIGDREWFGDNLNYKMEGAFCFKDDDSQCDAYGSLYTWAAAVKACPEGFRLPSQEDFESLWTAAGADFNAAYLLKASYGWSGGTDGNDTLKFGAMAAGNRFDDETYGNLLKFAFFWSSDDTSEGIPQGSARVWYMTSKSMAFSYMSKTKDFGFSVRCVR